MKVSVRLMTYNHGDYIVDALNGVNDQITDFKFEVVVGDDFSTDDTLIKISNFKITNPNLTLCVLDRKKGDAYDVLRQKKGRLYNFVNILNNCKGDYIALLDGDDYWTDPLKLQKQVGFLEKNTEYSMCFHEAEIVNAKSEVLNLYNNIKTVTTFSLYSFTQKNNVSTASCMFRNNITISDKFQKLKVGDWGLHILNAEVGKICYMPESMSAYRIHDGGIWSSLNHNDMVLKGVEVMKKLDIFFDYKYHDDFQEGIDKRLLKLKKEKKPPTFIERIRAKIKYLIN